MSFKGDITLLLGERSECEGRIKEAQDRIAEIDAEIADVKELLGIPRCFQPVADAPARKRRSDAGVPRKFADRNGVPTVEGLHVMFDATDAARDETEASDA